MIPLKHEHATSKMVGPPDRDDIRPLYVAEIEGCFVSRWEPTPEELTVLNNGGSVELWVMGSQPPVMLTVSDPGFDNGD